MDTVKLFTIQNALRLKIRLNSVLQRDTSVGHNRTTEVLSVGTSIENPRDVICGSLSKSRSPPRFGKKLMCHLLVGHWISMLHGWF